MVPIVRQLLMNVNTYNLKKIYPLFIVLQSMHSVETEFSENNSYQGEKLHKYSTEIVRKRERESTIKDLVTKY